MLQQVEQIFTAFDAEFTAKQIEWARGRVAAIKEYRASDAYRTGGRGGSIDDRLRADYAKEEKLHNLAGGKTWYNLFYGRNWDMIEPLVVKNCEATFANRNARIVTKLEKAGATEVTNLDGAMGTGGINGWFSIKTDAGLRRVAIETIAAGGYNIQCLHARVLVNVSKEIMPPELEMEVEDSVPGMDGP